MEKIDFKLITKCMKRKNISFTLEWSNLSYVNASC